MTQPAAPTTTAPRPVPRHYLGNVPVDEVGFARTVELVAGWAGREPFRQLVTPNVDNIIHLQKHADFRRAYEESALSLADGKPVLWAARYLGLPPLEKVSGSDLVPELCRRGDAAHWRVYIAGGRDEAELALLLRNIGRRFPGLTLGGTCPPLGFERDAAESARIVERIRQFAPDLLLFGCGAPKSEVWMARHAGALGRGVGLNVGAGLRMLAGLERRAPRWMQRVGLEWLWRLAREPRRLWRRYLVYDMQFFPLVWRWKRQEKARSAERGVRR
jgi:N-acetylglucosaminyldiphosphoundecaprenol N-acetyl-beta-D-mannosaminyltransferase